MPLILRASAAEVATFSKVTSVSAVAARARGWARPVASIQRAFLEAVGEASSAADWRTVQTALEDRNDAALAGALAWNDALLVGEVREAMLEAFRAAGAWELGVAEAEGAGTFEAEGDALVLGKKRPGRPLDVTTQEAVDWLRRDALSLVEDLSKRRRLSVSGLIEAGVAAGDTYQQVANRILRQGLIGLLPAQQRAVGNFRARRIKDGATRARAEKLAEAYAKQLLRYRAETIAKTEMAKAWAEGQIAGWRQAQRDGLISKRAQVEWVTVDPCEICAPLEGKRAPVGGRFYPGGYRRPGDTHPRCECMLMLVIPALSRGRGKATARPRRRAA